MTAQQKAHENYRFWCNNTGAYVHPIPTSFKRPNFTTGYGAILKALAKRGSLHSRADVLAAIGRTYECGYYSVTFQRLLGAELMTYDGHAYSITQLGRQFLAENCK